MKTRIGMGAALLLSACQYEPTIEQDQFEIINGELAVEGQFPAVGAFGFNFQGDFFQTCTATLIAPNIVLSAAHCVDPALNGAANLEQVAAASSVVFDQVNVNGAITGVRGEILQIFEQAQFDVNQLQNGNDISVIVLANNIVGIDPIPFNSENVANFVGQTFTAVGYGVSNAANQSGSGVQRFTQFDLEGFDNELTFYGTAGNDTTTGVCFGDSGGPDLITVNGETRVFGIHSFVFDGNSCLGGAAAQRTDSQVDFINNIIDQFALPPEPEDICVDNDGVCGLGCSRQADNDCGLFAARGCSVDVEPASSSSVASLFALFGLFSMGLLISRRKSR